MAEKNWFYEKLDEEYKVKRCPQNDYDGSITGKIVIGVPEWFDENPAERIRLGWTKHITHQEKDVDYNRQTQYVVKSTKRIDEYTIEDEFHVMDKSEEMMLMEEICGGSGMFYSYGGITFVGGEF